MGVGSSICVVLALTLAIPPPPGGARPGRLVPVDLGDPPELTPPDNVVVVTAQRHMDAGRYAEAANAYEALWRELGDPRLAYQAGLARARAGQNALAVRHFTAYLERATGASAETRARVSDRLETARAQTVAVRIFAVEPGQPAPRRLGPEQMARAELRIESVGGRAPDPGSVITLANYAGEEVVIDPAPVVVHLRIPGYQPVSMLRNGNDPTREWDIPVARQKVPVALRFEPERALRSARLQLWPTDGAQVAAIDQVLETPSTTVMLTSGSWSLEVSSRRHSGSAALTVTPGMRPVTVSLSPRGGGGGGGGGSRREFARSDVLAAVLGGGFIVTAATGLGLILAGTVKEAQARRANEDASMKALLSTADGDGTPSGLARLEMQYPTAALHADINRAYNLTTAGSVVLMSSTGALLAAITAQSRSRKIVAGAEILLGAAFMAGGGAWMAHALRRQEDLLAPTDPVDRVVWSDLRGLGGQRAGASILLGAGIGLVFFPALALVGDAAHQRRQRRRGLGVAPTMGRDHVGVTLRGQF